MTFVFFVVVVNVLTNSKKGLGSDDTIGTTSCDFFKTYSCQILFFYDAFRDTIQCPFRSKMDVISLQN